MRNNSRLKIIKIATYVTLAILLFGANYTMSAQNIIRGTIDLRETNIVKDDIVKLNGEWQFEYGNHLTSNELKKIKSDKKTYLKIPSSWTHISKKGISLPAYGNGTYCLKIILDEKNKINNYGLYIGNIISAYKLWINDSLVGQAGVAAIDSVKFKPIYLPQSYYFYSTSDTIDIVIQVSNFYDPIYAGLWQNIYIGERGTIEHYKWKIELFTVFIFSTFILLFLYQLSISFVQKAEKSHLIIPLLALISMIKMLLDGPISIYNFIPNLDFTIYYRLWLFSFFVIYLIVKLTNSIYPKEVNKKIDVFLDWLYGVFAISFLFIDIQIILSNIILLVYINLLCLGYIFTVLIKAVHRRRDYSIITLLSFTVMAMFVLNDLLFVVTQSSYGYLSHIGVMVHIVIQSITISLKYALSHNKVIQLSNELMDANRNLEVQVNIRTKELNRANEELESVNKQKDLLISTISHDLMGMFNTLITFSKSLYKDKTISDKQHITATKLYQISNKGYYMLDNILAWAKLHITYKQETKTITNLNELINENIYLLAEQIKNKSLIATVEINNEFHFYSSFDNLHTIIRNLLSNAIKFSNKGGQIKFRNNISGNYVQIEILDEGIGMSPEIMGSIFHPDTNKRREGTAGERGNGLGLFIVKELIESNNGKITCISKTDLGTQFIIEFPIKTIELKKS